MKYTRRKKRKTPRIMSAMIISAINSTEYVNGAQFFLTDHAMMMVFCNVAALLYIKIRSIHRRGKEMIHYQIVHIANHRCKAANLFLVCTKPTHLITFLSELHYVHALSILQHLRYAIILRYVTMFYICINISSIYYLLYTLTRTLMRAYIKRQTIIYPT
jgi:hypothetical protein